MGLDETTVPPLNTKQKDKERERQTDRDRERQRHREREDSLTARCRVVPSVVVSADALVAGTFRVLGAVAVKGTLTARKHH